MGREKEPGAEARWDKMMQKGYDLLREDEVAAACDLWLEVWDELKNKFSSNLKAIDQADKVFYGAQSLYNWCQDLEMELGNAGMDDPAYLEKRIKYIQEFCSLFPESDRLIMENMKRAEAESYFALGRVEEGEKLFARLVEEFPKSAWSYIGWADQYWLFPFNEDFTPNYEKAEEIYRMALAKDIDNREAVMERLKSLAERKKEEQHLKKRG